MKPQFMDQRDQPHEYRLVQLKPAPHKGWTNVTNVTNLLRVRARTGRAHMYMRSSRTCNRLVTLVRLVFNKGINKLCGTNLMNVGWSRWSMAFLLISDMKNGLG